MEPVIDVDAWLDTVKPEWDEVPHSFWPGKSFPSPRSGHSAIQNLDTGTRLRSFFDWGLYRRVVRSKAHLTLEATLQDLQT